MSSKDKIINKLVKIVSNEGRVLIGRLKCIDNGCTLYLSDVVEVFSKEGDHYVESELYKNNGENYFGFYTEKNYYQIYSPAIIPKSQVKQIIMLNN
jgi:small nuclear ribonucleoprotein (snRNP)-like protein